ncbi:carboxypeptidase regulatory-like domain-containing protein [Clavibacter tessellarius]
MVVVRPTTVGGTVTASDGSPVAGARVSLVAATDADFAGGSATTDAAGRYTVRDVDPGGYRVRVAAPTPNPAGLLGEWYGGAADEASGAIVTVSATDRRVVGIDAVLDAGARLRGVVRDAAGNGIADATVHLVPTDDAVDGVEPVTGREATTDASGAFEITGILPGDHQAFVAIDRESAPSTSPAGSAGPALGRRRRSSAPSRGGAAEPRDRARREPVRHGPRHLPRRRRLGRGPRARHPLAGRDRAARRVRPGRRRRVPRGRGDGRLPGRRDVLPGRRQRHARVDGRRARRPVGGRGRRRGVGGDHGRGARAGHRRRGRRPLTAGVAPPSRTAARRRGSAPRYALSSPVSIAVCRDGSANGSPSAPETSAMSSPNWRVWTRCAIRSSSIRCDSAA